MKLMKPWFLTWCWWNHERWRLKAGMQVTHQKNNDGCLPRRAWRLIKNRSFGISAFLHVCAMAWLQLVSQNRRSCSFIGFVWNNFDVFMESPHIWLGNHTLTFFNAIGSVTHCSERSLCADGTTLSYQIDTSAWEWHPINFDPCVFINGFDISFVFKQ